MPGGADAAESDNVDTALEGISDDRPELLWKIAPV